MPKRISKPRATVKCGSTSETGLAHGCGAGATTQNAIDAAIAEAQIAAQAAAESWIAAQVCPVRCPIKHGAVYSPPRARAKRRKAYEVLSTLKVLAPATRQNGGGPTQIFRICVVIFWEAVVECKAGFEPFE